MMVLTQLILLLSLLDLEVVANFAVKEKDTAEDPPYLSSSSSSSSRLSRKRLWFDVTEWGVVGDGIHDDTDSMRELLVGMPCNDCHKHIVIPKHAIVKTYPLNLTSHTTLQVDGILSAIPSMSHWPIIPPVPIYATSEDRNGGYLINMYQGFLYAQDATDIRITGSGLIDGGGPYWWDLFDARNLTGGGRPNLIQMVNCTHLEYDSVTLQDSPFWTVHPILSKDIHIHHLKIRAPLYAPNVDGIDPDSSENVMIEYNDVACGDDNIAIKAGVCGLPTEYINDCRDPIWSSGAYATRNVTVRHNIFRTGMGIAVGSEMSGGVHDVFVYNNTVGLCLSGADDKYKSCGWGPALHVKTTITRSGVIENVIYENNTVYNNSMFIFLETNYQKGSKQIIPPGYPKVLLRNIVFRNNVVLGEATAANFHCHPKDPCHNIQVVNNTITKADNKDHSPWECSFIDSYQVSGNYPSGLEDCMAESMNTTPGVLADRPYLPTEVDRA
jgi:polygalacturonase